jgi:nuclear pore complex protein Nup85
LDIWLAAHLADVFDKLAMVPDEDRWVGGIVKLDVAECRRFDMSLRDYFLLEYTDVLSGNDKHNHLWKVIADYLNAAGDEGRRRLKELILHVSLDSANDLSTPPVNPPRNTDQDDDMEMAEPAVPSAYERFYAIREACQTLNLHDEYATISRIMGNDLLRKGDFGIAAVMFAEAQDALALSHLADRVFDEFVNKGEEAFLAVVSQLPPILLDEGPTGIDEIDNMDQFGPKATVSAYSARLAHLAVFRDYLLYKQQGDREMSADRLVSLLVSSVAPVKDKSVLLAESIGLLEGESVSQNKAEKRCVLTSIG